MPRQQLELVARVRPRTPESLGSVDNVRNWQIEALGRELLATLARA